MDKWLNNKFKNAIDLRANYKKLMFKRGEEAPVGTSNSNVLNIHLKRRFSRQSAPTFNCFDVDT